MFVRICIYVCRPGPRPQNVFSNATQAILDIQALGLGLDIEPGELNN